MNSTTLQNHIDRLPRARVALLPTPLQDCPQLSARLNGPRILVKRDDLTGLGLGGNKVRGLEFVVGDALEKGADTLVTWGTAGSVENHCRLTAAVAARAGLHCEIVLGGAGYEPLRANAKLCRHLGARHHFVTYTETEKMRIASQDLVHQLKAKGRRPYLVDAQHCFYGGYAAIGYALCVLEMLVQFSHAHVFPDYVYLCSEGGTQAGLMLGKALTNASFEVIAFAPTMVDAGLPSRIAQGASEGARLLGLELNIPKETITNMTDFATEDNRSVGKPCANAVRLAATTEALILDPVYTGKAMAGLINHVKKGRRHAGETILFLHTGGTPVLSDYLDETGEVSHLRLV